jgi:hypothetical protein
LVTYRALQIDLLNLPKDQTMIWLIDCWSVHVSKDFRLWMKKHHPEIHLLFIPANCTSIFQPADVRLQRPFKHAFHQEFNQYTMGVISKKLEEEVAVKVDFKMSTLKPMVCGWLFTTWQHLTSQQDMVSKGWMHTGLLQAFNGDFQKEAMIQNMKTPLFNVIEEESEVETSIYNENEEFDAKVSLNTVMEVSLKEVTQLRAPSCTPSMATIRKTF